MDYETIIKEQFNNIISEEEFSSIINDADKLTGGLSSEFRIEDILESVIHGESIFDTNHIIHTFTDLMLYEVKNALIICVEIISICIIIGILKGLSSSFNSKNVSDISLLICSIIIIGISINSYRITYNLALDSIGTMVNTMGIIMPILIGILISTGSIASGTILSPIIIGAITGVAFIIKTFILPALYFSTILSLINCLTEKNYVNKFAKLIRNLSIGVTGGLLVILTGVITIQGLLSETSDGLLISTAKYSLSNFIPIVGNFTSDTVELFLKCMSSIKNVIGIFGIVIIILILAIPLIKIFAIAIIYKVTAALAEPVTDSKIADGLNDMGSCVISISAIMFFTTLLFIMFISTILNIGGN